MSQAKDTGTSAPEQSPDAETFFAALNAFVPPGPGRGLRMMQKAMQAANARAELAEHLADELQAELASLKKELRLIGLGA
jgi:hypothetical protein